MINTFDIINTNVLKQQDVSELDIVQILDDSNLQFVKKNENIKKIAINENISSINFLQPKKIDNQNILISTQKKVNDLSSDEDSSYSESLMQKKTSLKQSNPQQIQIINEVNKKNDRMDKLNNMINITTGLDDKKKHSESEFDSDSSIQSNKSSKHNTQQQQFIVQNKEQYIQQVKQQLDQLIATELGIQNYIFKSSDQQKQLLYTILTKKGTFLTSHEKLKLKDLEQVVLDNSVLERQQTMDTIILKVVQVFLNYVEKINFKFSFLQFNIDGWADNIYGELQSKIYLLRHCFHDLLSKFYKLGNLQQSMKPTTGFYNSPYVTLLLLIFASLFSYHSTNNYINGNVKKLNRIQQQYQYGQNQKTEIQTQSLMK